MRFLPRVLASCVTVLLALPDAQAEDAPTEQMLKIAQAMTTLLGFEETNFHDYTGMRTVTGSPADDELKAGGSIKIVGVDVYPTPELAAAQYALNRDYLLSDFAGNYEKGTATILANRLVGIVNRKAVTAYTTTTVEGKTRAIGGAEVLFLCDNLLVKVLLTSASTIAYPESNLEQLNAETVRLGQAAVAPIKAFAAEAVTAICGEPTAVMSVEPELKYGHVTPQEFLTGTVTLKVTGAWPHPSTSVWIALYKEDDAQALNDIITGKVTIGNTVDYALRSLSPVNVGTYVYQLGENKDLALQVPQEVGTYLLMAVAGDPVGGTGLNVFAQTGVEVERFPKRFYLRSAVVAPTLDGGIGDTFTLNVTFDVGSVVGPPEVSVRSNLTGPDPRGIPAVAVTNLTPLLGMVDGGMGTIGYNGTATVTTPPLLYAGDYAWPFTLFAPGWEPQDGEGTLRVDLTGFPLDVVGSVTVENETGTALPATNVLRFGRRLRTAANAEASITFQNGATLKIGPGTTMRIESNGQVHVEAGEVSVVGNTGDPSVTTPLATVTPTGTAYSVSHDPTLPATHVSVTTGQVQVTPTNAAYPSIAVGAGQSVEVEADAGIFPPPSITSSPTTTSAIVGKTAQFTVAATSTANLSYQWQQQIAGGSTWSDLANGGVFSGATSATLSISTTLAMHGDQFRVLVHTTGGSSTTSAAVALAVTSAPRLLNLSTRAQAQTGDNILIPGFVVSGTGTKQLLIRAVGPTLSHAPYNIATALTNPRMALKRLDFSVNPPVYLDIDANDDWQTNANATAITQAMANLFAFPFEDDREAALLVDLIPGQYTVFADGVNSATGIAIVELYDADPATTTTTLVNISNRGFVGTGDSVMIPGFVVSQEGPKTLLIRVVAPTLAGAPFNVPGTMADPQLEIFLAGSNTPILANDNWGDNPDAAFTASTAQAIGAFALANGSADAAFVVTLPPGTYTVVGSSADGTGTGVVLVEVYVVP